MSGPKKVQTFVSHCWNEIFAEFVGTMIESLSPGAVIWVCSFALPQNVDVGMQLSSSLQESPFARALIASERVLLAVDSNIQAWKRCWCNYEMYLAIKHKVRMDIRAHKMSLTF